MKTDKTQQDNAQTQQDNVQVEIDETAQTQIQEIDETDLNEPLGAFTLTEERTVRASGATIFSNVKPTDPTMLAKDHGEGHKKQARFEIFEDPQHKIKVQMDFTGDTIKRLARHAFSELWIKAQAKIRKKIALIGNEAFEKELGKNDGVVTFETAVDFQPRSNALSSADKAQGEIAKVDDMDELDRLLEQVQRQREKVVANMKEKQ